MSQARCLHLELLVTDKKLLRGLTVNIPKLTSDDILKLNELHKTVEHDITEHDEDESSNSKDSTDNDSIDEQSSLKQHVKYVKKLCQGCKMPRIPEDRNIRACTSCTAWYGRARTISTQVNVEPMRYSHQDFNCTCKMGPNCNLCRYNRLHLIMADSRKITELMKRQQEACAFCDIEYSTQHKYEFYYCDSCNEFIIHIGVRYRAVSVVPSTVEKLKRINSTGFIAKFFASPGQKYKLEEIKKIIAKEFNDIIDKFNRASAFNRQKTNIIIKLLKDIQSEEDPIDLEILLGIYLTIITSCRSGYLDQSNTGIFSLELEEFELFILNSDFRIKFKFDGKAGVPLLRDFNIDKIVYVKLEELINKKNAFLFDQRICSNPRLRSKIFNKVMDGLNPMVIRTSNASEYFQKLLTG